MSGHSQSKYQFIFVFCLALGISLFCADAKKRDDSDRNFSEEDEFRCPNYFGNYPDPKDCESYYQCNYNLAQHRQCPEWTKFDIYRRCCQPHYMAVCEKGSDENKTTVEDFNCPNYYGDYSDPQDCESYYECNHNVAKHRTCPEWTKFDKYSRCCKPHYMAICEEGSERNKTTIEEFNCPKYYGNFADLGDCDSYYECNHNVAKRRKCSEGMKFDKYRRCCQPSHMAVCANETSKFECPTYYGNYPDPEDCESYYECDYYKPIYRKCDPWTRFDKYSGCCKPHYMVECEVTTTSTTVKEEETTEMTTEKDEETTGVTTEKDEETTGVTTEKKEETTAVTTEKEEKTTEVTTLNEETTTIKDEEFICESMSGFFPHPLDCSKFYKCSFFTSLLKSCPKDQLFDDVKKECKPASEVDCGSRKRPTSPTDATTKKPLVPPQTDCADDDLNCIIKETGQFPDWFECPEYLGSYPHPSSKRLFIFCVNQKPFVKKCGKDMIFSEDLRTCVNA